MVGGIEGGTVYRENLFTAHSGCCPSRISLHENMVWGKMGRFLRWCDKLPVWTVTIVKMRILDGIKIGVG